MKAMAGFYPGNCSDCRREAKPLLPLRLRASMKGGAVGVGVAARGRRGPFLFCESVVELGGAGWGLGCGDMRGWVVAGS